MSTQGWRTVSPERATRLIDVALAPDGALVACGQNGRLLRSTDGGDTWAALPALKKPYFTTACGTPDGALLVGDWKGNLQVSRDGGRTFTGYKLRGAQGVVGLATNGRSVVALDPGGASWAPVGSDTWKRATGMTAPVWFKGLCADDAGHYWVCGRDRGAGGGILVSRDDGRTWQDVPVADAPSLHAIATSGARVWAAGEGDEVLRSPDRGATWARVKLPAGDPNGLGALVAAGDAALVGGRFGQAVYLTEDVGATWHRVADFAVEALALTPAGTVLAVGAHGIVARDFPSLAGRVA